MREQQDLEKYYIKRKAEFGQLAQEYKRKVFVNSLLRVFVFVTGAFLVYYLSYSTPLLLIAMVSSIALFLFLVKRQVNLKATWDHYNALKEINEKELVFRDHAYFDFDSGSDLSESNHPYCLDIDVFGRGSFFQYINRTVLDPARTKLGRHLLENSIEGIEDRQVIIQQLSKQNDWCQNFLAEAYSIKTDVKESSILTWLHDYQRIASGVFKFLPIVMTIISLIALGLLAGGVIAESIVMLVLFVGLGISSMRVKNVNKAASKMAKSHHLFQQYAKLLHKIEMKDFDWLISGDEIKTQQPSKKIQQFSKLLNSLNQRNNILISIFANGFFLRDIWICSKIDKWIFENQNDVETWFNLLHDYDKYISLGIFAFNHNEEIVYPELVGTSLIQSDALAHPLLAKDKRVANNFNINNNEFNIITGANMAGKSTFLRTVGLSIVMANSGLPVVAKSFIYHPIKLISSMRTSDSLSENESYFFAELKRLQYLVNEIKETNYFIILDEILKGTNSKDKAEGSEKFLVKLSKSSSSGIIATHDLSLCKVADEIETVHNRFFDAQIIDDQLFFDYKLKDGVCSNMNASFLMKKMNLV